MGLRFIGVDNGVTGSISILNERGKVLYYEKIPVFKELNYTKTTQYLNRVDTVKLFEIFEKHVGGHECMAYIERPMINPSRWKASVSAIRCLEATLIVLNNMEIPHQYIDSKEWQEALLPIRKKPKKKTKKKKKGKKQEDASKELKEAGVHVAKRLFPKIDCKKDADGLLIGEHCRRCCR